MKEIIINAIIMLIVYLIGSFRGFNEGFKYAKEIALGKIRVKWMKRFYERL